LPDTNIRPKERGEAVDIWGTPRGIELRTMLDWNNVKIPDWVDKIRYMLLQNQARQNEFKSRPVLAEPSDYIK
jgi:hypothetical protein